MKKLLKEKSINIFIILLSVLSTYIAFNNICTNWYNYASQRLESRLKPSNTIFCTNVVKYCAGEGIKVDGDLKVHFIDVGDADSILIQQGGKSMLIDAGNNADSEQVKEYIINQGLNKLDVVLGTHNDEDHIGSLDTVIDNFQVEKFYMPKCEISNKYFEDVLASTMKKDLEITEPSPGESFSLGSAICTILAPVNHGYEKLNNYSIVMKLQFGEISFLFTGDAEILSEKEMMRRGFDLSANVLKVGHHGSISSTCNEFLDKVNPKYAVIMVGKNNYFHPHKRIMNKLKDRNILIYRTDENGTIIATCNGKNIVFNKKPGSYNVR